MLSSSWDGSGKATPSTSQPDTIIMNPSPDHMEGLRGNLHIRHLWQCLIDTIIDVIVMDTDVKYFISFFLG